jgi:hypothetical protein
MARISLIPDDSHPEGGYAFLDVMELSSPPRAGDCDIRIMRKSDELWLQPSGWGERDGQPLRIKAANVEVTRDRLRLKLDPQIVNHFSIETSYVIESPSHAFEGRFRPTESLKIGPKSGSRGHRVADATEPPPELTATLEPRDVVGTPPPTTTESNIQEPSQKKPEPDRSTPPGNDGPPLAEPEAPPVSRRWVWPLVGAVAGVAMLAVGAFAYFKLMDSSGSFDPRLKKAVRDYDQLRMQIGN